MAKRASIMVGRCTHAHQFKRARRAFKFLRARLGRLIRDIRRARGRVRRVHRQGQSPRAPYEFGCKVSVATPVTQPKGGQFVLHAKALNGNPFDGHTLGPVVADMERLTGIQVRRIHLDKGYRGLDYPNWFRVWISGQAPRVTRTIRREMRRRAAIEPVIRHLKAEHRMDRNHLLTAAG